MKFLGLEIKRVQKPEPISLPEPPADRWEELEGLISDLNGKHARLAHQINFDFLGLGLRALAHQREWGKIAELLNTPVSVLLVEKPITPFDAEYTQNPRYRSEEK